MENPHFTVEMLFDALGMFVGGLAIIGVVCLLYCLYSFMINMKKDIEDFREKYEKEQAEKEALKAARK